MQTYFSFLLGIALLLASVHLNAQLSHFYPSASEISLPADSQQLSPKPHLRINLSPQSAGDNTYLKVLAGEAGRLKLRIMDLGDQEIWQKEFTYHTGYQNILLSLYTLPDGWYWVEIELTGIEQTYFMSLEVER